MVERYITNLGIGISSYKYVPNTLHEVHKLIDGYYGFGPDKSGKLGGVVDFDSSPVGKWFSKQGKYLTIRVQESDSNYNNTYPVCYIDMTNIIEDIREKKINQIC